MNEVHRTITITRMDAAVEPPWMVSRRVIVRCTSFMFQTRLKSIKSYDMNLLFIYSLSIASPFAWPAALREAENCLYTIWIIKLSGG